MKQTQFTNDYIAAFCLQLAFLLHSGVRLSDSLILLSEEETNPAYREILSHIACQIDNGASLSSAFEETGCFPSHVTGLLEVGEQVGRTEETLTALSGYYEEKEQMNRQLKNSLTYPSVLFLMMLAVIIVLLTQVLPVFDDVYASLGGSLTGLAGGLLILGQALNIILPFVGVVIAVTTAVLFVISLHPEMRHKALHFWQTHWGDKGIFRKMNNARFAQALSMAFSSGLPLEEGVSLAASLLKDCPDAVKRCETCRACLDAGGDLSTALGESHMLTASDCRMLTLGMRAGTGDAAMERISHRLSEEAREALENQVAKVEPALVLITSILVGAILFSVMLPLMHIMKAIG